MSDTLPRGWDITTIPVVADVLDSVRVPLNADERARRTEGRSVHDLVPYYGATGQIGHIDAPLFDERLVLLGEDGVPFLDPFKRKAYRVSGPSWVNNHAHVLRAKPDAIDWRFLERQLNTLSYVGHVSGSTRLKLTQGAMNALPLKLAPYKEQQRIADKLDTVLARVDTVNARLARVTPLLKRFRQSVLAAATSGRLTADWLAGFTQANTEWTNVPLMAVCKKITDGEHISPPLVSDGIPLVSAKDVREWGVDFSDTKYVSEEFSSTSRQRCDPTAGDVLVVSRGATVGRTCLVDSVQEFCLMGSVLLFKPNQTLVHPKFLAFFLGSPIGLQRLTSASGATAQAAIYIRDAKGLEVALPSFLEQTEIVRRVELLFGFADRLEARLQVAQTATSRLTPSLLAKAFRGELVPQDPNDEPASELLKRLVQSQPVVATKGRTRKGA